MKEEGAKKKAIILQYNTICVINNYMPKKCAQKFEIQAKKKKKQRSTVYCQEAF